MSYQQKLEEFVQSDKTVAVFPASLSDDQRGQIHEICKMLGLDSESVGVKPNRLLTVTKKEKRDD